MKLNKPHEFLINFYKVKYMKQNLWLWQFGGFSFTSLLGTLLHFLYEWTNNSKLSALISGVNESTWEHMKLLFFPMLAYALLAGKRIEEQSPCIYNAMFTGILVGLVMIPVLFYTYSGILGFSVDWLNIALYAASVLVSYYAVYRVAQKCTGKEFKVLRYVMYGLILAFMIFTVYPPNLGIFVSPV